MSVRTRADDIRDQLKEKLLQIGNELSACDSLLSEMVNPDTWGGSDWNKNYLETVQELRIEIMHLKIKILDFNIQ